MVLPRRPPERGRMFNDAIGRAIAAAPWTELDRLNAEVWAAWRAELIDDATAQAAAEAIQARRKGQGSPNAPMAKGRNAPSTTQPRPRRQQSPDRRASIERQRRLVASGPLPPAMAARFTWGEQAVMRIVGDECRQYGTCTLHVDAIAARAGVHRTTVQNALREAQGRGAVPGAPLVHVQERRRKGQRSLTNIVRVVSVEWLTWLRRGPRRTFAPVGSNCTAASSSSALVPDFSGTTDTSKKEREGSGIPLAASEALSASLRTDAPSRRDVISRGGSPHPYGEVVSGGSRKEARR